MTKSIVKKIFVDDANRRESAIKKAARDIMAESARLKTLIGELKNDDAAKAIIADGQFAFLYDQKGAKDKPKMSDKMRQLKNAIIFLHDNQDAFLAWADNGEKTAVTSLRGIKDAIKPKKEKAEKIVSDASDDASADDTEKSDESLQNEVMTKAQAYEAFLMTWKKLGFGDSIAFSDYVATTEAGKIADKIDEQKAA